MQENNRPPDRQLQREGVNAFKWALVDKFGSQVIVLMNTLVLARLLNPHDFGLISVLYIFMSISSAFVDSGMGGGLVRKQDLSNTDCNTFFLFNIFTGVFFYGLLFFLAPVIANFYHEPKLIMLLRILSITVMINAVSLIHKSLLVKNLRYKLVTRASFLAAILSTIIALILAWKGFGVWSLITLQVSQSVFYMLLLWKFSGWLPGLKFSWASFKELYGFGFGLFLTALVNIIYANIYQPLIGKFFSIAYSGYFYQAKRLYEVPVLSISSVVDSVTYPILVRYQNNREGLVENYQKIVRLLLFVSIPIIITIGFLAHPLVLVLLGKKWLFSADLLQILSFSGIFLILETINGSLMKVEGRTKLIFKLEVLKKVIITINIIIFCQFGIKTLVYGIVINSFISFLINQYFTSIRIASYKKLFTLFIIGSIMAIVILNLTRVILNPYYAILLGGTSGVLTYLTASYLLKFPELRWIFMIITNKIKTVS
jgi:teichuronic acid exporter